MSCIILLAPGPSMSRELAESVKGLHVGTVCNSYELAPWANFLVANDKSWWHRHPSAIDFDGDKYSAALIDGVIKLRSIPTYINSGVVALDVAKMRGATEIILLGFDMHGTHFFRTYKNGCKNTSDERRAVHLKQYESWARLNKSISVINCTEGSALTCFPTAKLEEVLC